MLILFEIEQAFAFSRNPTESDLFNGDDEGAPECFRKRCWCDFSTEVIDFHSAALSFLSPTGFGYYLRAFMAASIRNEELGMVDVVIDR